MCGKSSPVWAYLVIISVTVILLGSCSQVSPSPNTQSSSADGLFSDAEPTASPVELTSGQTTEAETPVRTNRDLNGSVGEISSGIDGWSYTLTAVENLNVTGTPQDVDIASYRLTLEGLVDTPLKLSYEEILIFTPFSKVIPLVCPDFFVDIAKWTGAPVAALLNTAGLKPGASEVLFYSLDGYKQRLSLPDAQKEGVFLAYKVNDQVLPKEHGYPLRLVVEGTDGNTWVKWIDRIEVR